MLASLCVLAFLSACRQPDAAFKARLRKFDIQLSMGDTREAARLLSGADCGSSLERLSSVLKREYRLSLLSGDTRRYARATLAAVKANGSLTLRALAAQALLADGRGGEARRILGDAARGASTGELPKLAMALALDESAGLDARTALARGADFWADLAQSTGRGGYYQNAALSALYAGDRSRAAIEARACIDSGFPLPPELAYDCALYEDCLDILERSSARGLRPIDAPGYAALAASAALLAGDPSRARAAWNDAISAFPASASAAFRNLAATETSTAGRRELLERAAALYPGDEERLLDLAAFYASEGLREEGLAAIEGLDEANPELLPVRLSLGIIQAEGEQAEASLLKAVQADPGNEDVLRSSFFSLFGLKRYEAAFRLLIDSEAAATGRGAAWTSFASACLLAAQGRTDEAIDAFDSCASGEVHYASLWNAALLLSRKGYWSEARKRLKDAIAMAAGGREKALAYVFLGDCERLQGRREEARTAYLAALSQWPECPQAGLALAGLEDRRTKE